jgi:hypothetical protein
MCQLRQIRIYFVVTNENTEKNTTCIHIGPIFIRHYLKRYLGLVEDIFAGVGARALSSPGFHS